MRALFLSSILLRETWGIQIPHFYLMPSKADFLDIKLPVKLFINAVSLRAYEKSQNSRAIAYLLKGLVSVVLRRNSNFTNYVCDCALARRHFQAFRPSHVKATTHILWLSL